MDETAGYFEHGADMGIIGRGARMEQAFEHTAQAMFAMMADPAGIRAQTRVTVEFEEADPELALVTWLNRLLGEARSRGLVFGSFRLSRDGARLPGLVGAAMTMPDAHWGYGFPIGGVAAFDAEAGGIISAGGVGFDISCGIRCLRTKLDLQTVAPRRAAAAEGLHQGLRPRATDQRASRARTQVCPAPAVAGFSGSAALGAESEPHFSPFSRNSAAYFMSVSRM